VRWGAGADGKGPQEGCSRGFLQCCSRPLSAPPWPWSAPPRPWLFARPPRRGSPRARRRASWWRGRPWCGAQMCQSSDEVSDEGRDFDEGWTAIRRGGRRMACSRVAKGSRMEGDGGSRRACRWARESWGQGLCSGERRVRCGWRVECVIAPVASVQVSNCLHTGRLCHPCSVERKFCNIPGDCKQCVRCHGVMCNVAVTKMLASR
jgi:hypothetical protein